MRHACGWVFVLIFLAPAAAIAQYKNTTFGVDAGYTFITRPTVLENENLGTLKTVNRRPLRLRQGVRFGGESNFKIDNDNWWGTFRLNGTFLRFSPSDGDTEAPYDAAANDALGTIFGIQGMMGLRYVFSTNKIRPYMQVSLSYMRLFSFTNDQGETCVDVCTGGTNFEEFMPHPNVGGFHLQPGLEFIFQRDTALHLSVDLQRWIIINADDNHSITVFAGVLFYI